VPVRQSSRFKHQYQIQQKSGFDSPVEPRAAAARLDLGAFGEFVAGKSPAEHHRSWFPYLALGEGNLDLLAPRGSAKSTWVALYAAWMIGHNPGIQIIYVGYSESVALKQSRIIKRLITSPNYRKVFPNVRLGERKSDTDWEIDKQFAGVDSLDSDYTLYAVGITGAITSRRANLILIDDPIKSSASIANPDIREKIATNWKEVLRPTLIPGGRVICIATRFRADDCHATEFIASKGWTQIEQSAILTDSEGREVSYWPERFPLSDLQELREDPITFSYQYQNKVPPNEDEAIIKPAWIRYRADVPTEFDELVLGVDLAASESEKADYTALVLIGKRGEYYWILDAVRFRAAGNLDKCDRIIALYQKWKRARIRVIVERVAYQASFEGDWKRYMRSRRFTNLTCEEFVPKGDKDQRLEGVSGIFANGYVLMNKSAPLAPLVDELLRISLTHDDLSDACVMALARLQRKSRSRLSSA
jgi:phage terminase large subunit-like protein